MPKIREYTQAIAAKLADLFVMDTVDSNVHATKSVTLEQMGDAIAGTQSHASLNTSDKTIIGAINEIASYTPVYGNTASGSIATFDTSLALPLQDCTIEINAVQESGTPTPSSPKLISGFTGANIVDCGGDNTLATYIKGIYQGIYGFVDLGSLNWTYDAESVPSNPYFFCQRDTVKVSTQNLLCSIYQLANVGVANMPDMSMKSNNKGQVLIVNHNYTNATTFKTAMSGVYLIYELETPTTPTITQAQLTAICTSFNTSGTIYPITWQSEAGTVYGGSLRIANGYTHLVDNRHYVDLGSLSWNNASGNLSSSSGIASDVKAPSANTQAFNGLCSCYAVAPRTGISDKQISVQTNGNIVISDTAIAGMTGEQVKTYVNGFILVYELATPVTYQLTPTQISAIVGTNNVFTDTNGNTSVVYACSLKDYIDSQ